MATRKSPLRDRLLSNSPDPIKSSILRESGMGWNSPPSNSPSSNINAGSITSPLRVAKRSSPGRPRGADVARRSSSSFKHVRNNNLVSKSPFKTQIPTPSTPSSHMTPIIFPTPRRVSGEKRPRPSSMHEQAENENERPFALKRERKQSKTFQGLIEKEPVTKSPFKLPRRLPSEDVRPLSPAHPVSRINIPVPATSHIAAPTTTNTGILPGRSSLVSRRLHGPRLSGGAKRERRKTVSFDERCDVVEFAREEESDEDVFTSADEDELYGRPGYDNDGEDPFFQGPSLDNATDGDESYESIQLSDADDRPTTSELELDPDSSITGLVEEIFFSGKNHANTSIDSTMSTPPRHSDIPTDLETEDGIPFGRSHHVERFLQHQQHQRSSPRPQSPNQRLPSRQQSPASYPFNLNLPTHPSPHGPPATPPRRSPGMSYSTPPLGRSTHIERIRQAREEEKKEVDDDMNMLPVSPSPMKNIGTPRSSRMVEESLIPRFDLTNSVQPNENISLHSTSDPFSPPQSAQTLLRNKNSTETFQMIQELSEETDKTEDCHVDFKPSLQTDRPVATEHSEVEPDNNEHFTATTDSPRSITLENSGDFTQSTEQYYSPDRSRVSPNISSNSSPALNTSTSSLIVGAAGRQRISKEDVKRRLMKQRSFESPSPEATDTAPATPEAEVLNEPRFEMEGIEYLPEGEDKDRDRMSVMTFLTDISTETAVVQKAEKKMLGLSTIDESNSDEKDSGSLRTGEELQVDFGDKFGLGGLGIGSTSSRGSLGPLPTDSDETTANSIHSGISSTSGIKLGDVDVDMDMKSALDRLMDDVAGSRVDESMLTEDYDDSYTQDPSHSTIASNSRPKVIERAATEPALLQINGGNGVVSRTASGSSSMSIPPPVPPKDNIKNREQMIIERRREARRLEEEEDHEFRSTARHTQKHLGVGLPSRRRSMSTGDAEVLGKGTKRRGNALLDAEDVAHEDPLADSIEKELNRLKESPRKSKYLVRERGTIYASSSEDRITHMAGPGDVDVGRAWRTVRRPSDMNEYSKQIKEYRAQEIPGKAYGKVFVKVLGVKGIHLPLPQEDTAITCTLNNGIHFVTTPECKLASNCRIDQEFELIEHSKLEFTLTLKVRRDPHIISQYKAIAATPPVQPPPPPAPIVQAPSRSGMRSFFSSSPKKSSKEKIVAQPPPPPPVQPPQRLAENLARYLKPDGTLARAFISFKDLAHRCDTRLFETSYPLIGQRVEIGGKFSTLQVGEITMQIFRLPPLHGIAPDQIPQSLEECHRGLRHINWHKVTYFQGTLTQIGGDCSTWRRRQLRVIGANLIAFNDVTKKATATIDLKKAIAVEDDQPGTSALSPVSAATARSRYADDGLYGVERSFRLIFPREQEIVFFADTDEEKARWLEVLRALVGRIPPHPLWAELLWQRQDELSKRSQVDQPAIQVNSSHNGVRNLQP